MKKNSFETILYSVIGVLALLLILVAANVISGVIKKRIDFTQDKAYTLSPGTRAILAKITKPVKIRFFYSSSAELPSGGLYLKTYAQRVQDMLAEYKQASGGKLIVQQFDPKPDSDAEDEAHKNGVDGQQLNDGSVFYLGASVSVLENSQTIPFFNPDDERLLEYKLSQAISRVITPEKPVIGIMSGLPIFGVESNPMMEQMGGPAPQDPWAFVSALKEDFNVKQVDLTADKIDDDIKVLIVVHPKEISDKTQFAIDQFLMRGGRLVAFLDAISLLDKSSGGMPGGAQLPGAGTSLDKLLKAWGIQFDNSKVVADLTYENKKATLRTGPNPGWIALSEDRLNKDDVVTSQLGEVWIPFGGVFTGTPTPGLKETVLLKTSKDSQLVEGMMAALSGDSITKDFKPSGTEYTMGLRLTGKFKTAFTNGAPVEKPVDAAATNQPPKPADSLKESAMDTAVVLIADSDMFSDMFSVQKVQTPFGEIPRVMNGNLDLAQGLVENLAGDTDLIAIRSRATTSRPFTRIDKMEAKAEEAYQGKINEYEQSLQETRQRLAELQKTKDQNQQFVLSPEQQAEIEKLRKKEGQVNHDLKQERKELARDIDSTKNWIKWGNIIGMPLLVAISGICLAGIKRRRTSAK